MFKFDHHCGWLNNCIGYKNLWLFVLFLGFHAALCGYGLLFIAALLLQLYRTVRSGSDVALARWAMEGGGMVGEPPPAMTPERLQRLVGMARGKQPLGAGSRGGFQPFSSPEKQLMAMVGSLFARATQLPGTSQQLGQRHSGVQHFSDLVFLPVLREMGARGVDLDDYNTTAALLLDRHERSTSAVAVVVGQPVMLLVALLCIVIGLVLGIATILYLEMAAVDATSWEHRRSAKYFEERHRKGWGAQQAGAAATVPVSVVGQSGDGFRRRGGAASATECGDVEVPLVVAAADIRVVEASLPTRRRCCWRRLDQWAGCCCCCCWGSVSAFDRGDWRANCAELWRAPAMPRQ